MAKTLTNRLGLPQGIVNAVKNDPYNSGDSDISVTRLITPPYQRKLMETVDQTEDVSDRIWSLIGQSTHAILERAYPAPAEHMETWPMPTLLAHYGYVTERRLFGNCNGWRVSGAFDVLEDGTMFDYKITSVWSVIGETKIEWEQQLNLLRLLAIQNGIQVDRLRIIAILRDWSKMKAKLEPEYPQSQVCPVDIPVWSQERAEAYMLDRVKAHQDAAPPPCTDVERWAKPTVYAVMKEGNKRAFKLHESANSAAAHVAELGPKYSVVTRPGEYTRCANYCAVAHNCPQFQGEVAF